MKGVLKMSNEMANGFVTIVCDNLNDINRRIKKVQRNNKFLTTMCFVGAVYIVALVKNDIKQDQEIKKLSDEIKELKSVKGE